MTDSFQYIKDHVRLKELKDQEISDRVKMERENGDRIWDARRDLWKPYSQMVRDLLTELKNLCYPSFEIYDNTISCGIGQHMDFEERYGGGRHKRFVAWVEVTLEYDKSFARAIRFKCSRRGGYDKRTWLGRKKYIEFGTVSCGLNRQELLAALTRLHPKDSL